MTEYDLGILGLGNMAEAIVAGLLATHQITADRVIGSARTDRRRDDVRQRLGVRMVDDNQLVASGCNTLVLGIKPQMAAAVLPTIADSLCHDPLIVSIMAAVPTATIDRLLGGGRRVVRTMPNTPVLVGKGVVAIAGAPADVRAARFLFESSATIIEVEERQLDAVTAVSGSGPAYFFYFVEQMIRASVALGLSPEQSTTLAKRTIGGAAAMLEKTADDPAELRRKVTSPNGTTHAAIETFRAAGLDRLICEAMFACANRSREIAAGINRRSED